MVLFTRPLAAAAALLTTAAEAASLEEVTDFGTNPSGAKMHIYVPDAVAGQQQQQDDNSKSTAAPVVVAIHFCTGTGPVYYASTPYAKLADEHGFVVVYPSSPHDGGCWDVSSAEAMQHQDASTSTSTSDTKGSDTAAIAQMTRWAVATYGGGSGAARAYVTGSSSGAMMTNLLAATYPDLFAAAVAYSGVPAGCFFTGTVAGWNATCSQGKSVSSQEGWRDVALAMYPGYQGSRPKMLILHGSADTSVLPEVSGDFFSFSFLKLVFFSDILLDCPCYYTLSFLPTYLASSSKLVVSRQEVY